MKKTTAIRNLLGITQSDLAQLLGVGRTQLAMFELGKRDLPASAKLLLAEALKHLKDYESEPKELPVIANQEAQRKERIEYLLKENEYRQLTLKRKMAAATKKYKNNITILKLTGFLAAKTEQKPTVSKGLLQILNAKASKALAENSLATLLDCELKKELLELEKLLLDSFLRKITKPT